MHLHHQGVQAIAMRKVCIHVITLDGGLTRWILENGIFSVVVLNHPAQARQVAVYHPTAVQAQAHQAAVYHLLAAQALLLI